MTCFDISSDDFEKLNLDQLPKYSGWPKKLIDASEATKHIKNTKEIYREYETDKWASLFSLIEHQAMGVDEVDSMQFSGSQQIPFSIGDELFVAKPLVTRVALAAMIANKIHSVRSEDGAVVELGAGTGAIIARLAKDSRFRDAEFYAGDFSPSSIKIIDYLAKAEAVTINTGLFDFHAKASELNIPGNSIIFTSFAVAYIQGLDFQFWQRIVNYNPKAIIIVEPIYEHFTDQTVLGLLRKKYYECNDYNRNILSSIKDAERRNILTIDEVVENVIGINPLCPVSMISLRPIR